MKILLPFQCPYDNPLNHPMVSGGIEMFCKSIYDNFDVVVHQVPFESTNNYSLKRKWQISREIINKAYNISADIIISNFPQTIFSGKEIIQSSIPILMIEHCFYPMMPTVIKRWNQAIESGHSLYFVSKFQKDKYDKVSIREGKRLLPSNFINPSYCKVTPDISPIEFDCGTIGRCDSGKAPFKLKSMTKGTDISSLVITSKTLLKKDEPYFNRNKDWDNVLWNQPYDVVMENLSKCGTYFSTWINETWGITSMEALSCGIPVILNCNKDGNHSSEIIPASPNHYVKIRNNNKEDLIKAIKSFNNIDRKEVQEMTIEKHGIKKWKSDFEGIIDKTIERFNKTARNQTLFN